MNTSARLPDRCAGLDFDGEIPDVTLPVVQLMVCGLSTIDIATRLDRSEDLVKNHLVRAFRATGATTRLHLVVWMYETGRVIPGIVQLPDAPPRSRQHLTTPLTADEAALLRLASLRHQLATTRAELDTLVALVEPNPEQR